MENNYKNSFVISASNSFLKTIVADLELFGYECPNKDDQSCFLLVCNTEFVIYYTGYRKQTCNFISGRGYNDYYTSTLRKNNPTQPITLISLTRNQTEVNSKEYRKSIIGLATERIEEERPKQRFKNSFIVKGDVESINVFIKKAKVYGWNFIGGGIANCLLFCGDDRSGEAYNPGDMEPNTFARGTVTDYYKAKYDISNIQVRALVEKLMLETIKYKL